MRIAAASLLIALAVPALAVPALAAPETTQASFGARIAQLRAGETNLDLRDLRLEAAAQPGYSAGGWGDYSDAAKALETHKDAAALALAEARLMDNFVDVRAQMVAAEALARLGRKPEGDRHHAIAQGLIEAIASGGDGKSAATAFTVISVDEEYVLLEVLGLRSTLQALRSAGGHQYDVLDVRDETGTTRQIWFNIDLVFGHEL